MVMDSLLNRQFIFRGKVKDESAWQNICEKTAVTSCKYIYTNAEK